MSTDDIYDLDEQPESDQQENTVQENSLDHELRKIGTMMQITLAACESERTDHSQADIQEVAEELADDMDEYLSSRPLSDIEYVLSLWELGLSFWDDEEMTVGFDDLYDVQESEELSEFRIDLLKIGKGVGLTVTDSKDSNVTDPEVALETARETVDDIYSEILKQKNPPLAAVIWVVWGKLLEYANNTIELGE